jgi:hypothetical protein
MRESYASYYAKNRDALVARMRERDSARREEERARAASDPGFAEEIKTKTHEKYEKVRANAVLRLLRQTAEKPILGASAKAFLEGDLIKAEAYRHLPMSAAKALCVALERHD